MKRKRTGGLFISVDGPGRVGKSTTIAATLAAEHQVATYVTTEPTRTPLGELLRHGTDTYQGLALALLVAGHSIGHQGDVA